MSMPELSRDLDIHVYSKTCVKRPIKIDKTKVLMTTVSLMKSESIAECSHWIFGLETHFLVILRVAILQLLSY